MKATTTTTVIQNEYHGKLSETSESEWTPLNPSEAEYPQVNPSEPEWTWVNPGESEGDTS